MEGDEGVTVEELAARLEGVRREGAAWEDESRRRAPVGAVRYHSACVQPGDVFVCIRGFRHDGHDYAPQAAQAGASLVVAERPLVSIETAVPVAVVPDTRAALGPLAGEVLGHPDRRIRLVGVTGTNGKTTTTYLVKAALEHAGHQVGLIGTIRHLIGSQEIPARRTSPEASDVLELLARMVARGVGYAVAEVSSHAVALKRTAGIEYDVAVFTNLTQDHLDFHGTMEAYRDAKAAFFAQLAGGSKGGKAGIVNADDPHGDYMARRCPAPVLRFGLGGAAEVRAEGLQADDQGVRFVAVTPWGRAEVRLRLGGRFNVLNALAALAVALHEGVALEQAVAGLASVQRVDGRFEAVRAGQPFSVIVDYAHTPDGLQNVLEAARALRPATLWVVFGCGGDRDRSKRPRMGAIAARLADQAIITSDNPRSEDPEAICREVEQGLVDQRRSGPHRLRGYEVVVDRRQAIRLALERARPGDLVLIAGKGHETYQELRDRTVPFDDRQVAREILEELGYGRAVGHGAG